MPPCEEEVRKRKVGLCALGGFQTSGTKGGKHGEGDGGIIDTESGKAGVDADANSQIPSE